MIVDIRKQQHQDNLKMEIYHKFKIRFINCPYNLLAEYRLPKCRFDLILYNVHTLETLCIIEVRRINARRPPKKTGNKHLKYLKHCPVFYISRYDEIDNFLDRFEKFLQKDN